MSRCRRNVKVLSMPEMTLWLSTDSCKITPAPASSMRRLPGDHALAPDDTDNLPPGRDLHLIGAKTDGIRHALWNQAVPQVVDGHAGDGGEGLDPRLHFEARSAHTALDARPGGGVFFDRDDAGSFVQTDGPQSGRYHDHPLLSDLLHREVCCRTGNAGAQASMYSPARTRSTTMGLR